MKLPRNALTAAGWALAYVAAVAVGSAIFARFLPTESRPTIVGNVAIALTGLIILWYTWETRRLRLESHDQVAVSREQAEISRRMFEASHRPFLEIQFHTTNYFRSSVWYRLEYRLRAHGHVPAIVTASRVSVVEGNTAHLNITPGQEVVFPGDGEDVGLNLNRSTPESVRDPVGR